MAAFWFVIWAASSYIEDYRFTYILLGLFLSQNRNNQQSTINNQHLRLGLHLNTFYFDTKFKILKFWKL